MTASRSELPGPSRMDAPLPFDLPPEELRRRASAIVGEAEVALRALPGAGHAGDRLVRALEAVLLPVYDLVSHGHLILAVARDEATRESGRAAAELGDRFLNRFRIDSAVYDLLQAVPAEALPGEAVASAHRKILREMRRAGVELDAPARARALELADEIDRISNEFNANIAKLVGTFEVAGPEELAGLPEDYRKAHPPGPDGRIRITTQYPDIFPVLAFAERPEVRERALACRMMRAHPQNDEVLDRLLARRYEFARLLGHSSYAAYVVGDKMLDTPARVRAFLEQVARLARPRAEHEIAGWLARKRRDEPGAARLEPWDACIWAPEGYYDSKIRREQYSVDPKELRSYLPYGAVRDGLFALCERLFGLAITRVHPEGLWHPTVEAYDVRRGAAPIGRFYLDMVPREGKYGHAAEFDVRLGIRGVQLPQAALVCNIVDPDQPPESVRLQFEGVITLFHEFGHLLHALLSGHGEYLYNSMGFIEWDFIETPSELFEEWASDPATVRAFARDPDTGRGLPEEVLARLHDAESVGRATRLLRQVACAAISLELYDRDPSGLDVDRLFREVFDRYFPIPLPTPGHWQDSWGHLTGYSAMYYTYTWSNVLARDVLTPFLERGTLTDPEIAGRYAEKLLAPGGLRPAAALLRDYLGREHSMAAFERWLAASPTSP
jgi:thimet oligopeptidase